jgi:hypothetical protein
MLLLLAYMVLFVPWGCSGCRMEVETGREAAMWPSRLRNACMLVSILVILCDAARAQTAPAVQHPSISPRADYRVVIWYRQDRPLDTFKYQIYDMRKGEYTPAVDAWLELMRSKHLAYVVTVRDVDLRREKGETESLKVGAVVVRELTAAASLEGIVMGGSVGAGLPRAATPRPGPATPPRGITSRRLPPGMGWPGAADINPPSYTYPFPVPFPRPRP